MPTQSCFNCIHQDVCASYNQLNTAALQMANACTIKPLARLIPQGISELRNILLETVSRDCFKHKPQPLMEANDA